MDQLLALFGEIYHQDQLASALERSERPKWSIAGDKGGCKVGPAPKGQNWALSSANFAAKEE